MFEVLRTQTSANYSKYPPRDYQAECFSEALRLVNEENILRQLYVLATGMGKTVVFSQIANFFPEHAKHGTLVLVHREELVFQAAEKIQESNPFCKVGVEKGTFKAEHDCDYIVASIQTIGRSGSRRLARFLDRIGVIIVDEAHHIKKGSQYATVLNAYGVGDAPPHKKIARDIGVDRLLFGFTATPNRTDGIGLASYFDIIAKNLDIAYGVQNAWLVPIIPFREKTTVDLDKVGTTAGDFDEGELENTVNVEPRNAAIVSAYLRLMRGELEGQTHIPTGQAIVFAAGVRHAHDLAHAFILAGIPAAAVDGNTDKDLRRSLVEAFKQGQIKVLCNCGVFTEGFDAPNCDIILMARPTKSQSLYVQMMGRGTRPNCNINFPTVAERVLAIQQSDKKCVFVIDFVDNTKNNKLITAPTLVGLRPDFNSKGKSLYGEIKEKMEKLQQENPTRPIKEAESFEEMEVIAEKVDIWDLAEENKPIREMSQFNWMEVNENVYHLSVPLKPHEFILRLEGDMLDNWRLHKIYPPRVEIRPDGTKVQHPQKIVHGEKTVKGLQNALSISDAWVRKKAPTCLNLMYHNPKWGKGPATPGQISKLRNEFGIKIPEGMKLTKLEASRLIEASIQHERHKRFIASQQSNGQ